MSSLREDIRDANLEGAHRMGRERQAREQARRTELAAHPLHTVSIEGGTELDAKAWELFRDTRNTDGGEVGQDHWRAEVREMALAAAYEDAEAFLEFRGERQELLSIEATAEHLRSREQA